MATRFLQWVLAVGVVGGPLAFLVGGVFSPTIHASGQQTIAGNAAADPTTNAVHLVAFFVASFLLPIGAVGLARLAFERTPWLATIGGLLAVLGWLPFSALTALDDLALAMSKLPDSRSYGRLYDVFSTDAVLNTYLIVYIVGHLIAYVLLGIALLKARAVPAWAAWALIVSSPLTIAVFLVPGRPLALGDIALGLVVLGSLPAARNLVRTPAG